MKTRLVLSLVATLALAVAGPGAASDRGGTVGGGFAGASCSAGHAVTTAGPATILFRVRLSVDVPVTVEVRDAVGALVAADAGGGTYVVPAAGSYTVRVCGRDAAAQPAFYSASLVVQRSAQVAGVSVVRGGGTVRTAHGLARFGLLVTSGGIARVRYDDAARGFHLRLRNAVLHREGNTITIAGIGATVVVVDRPGSARDTVSVVARGYRARGVVVAGGLHS